MVIRTFFDKNNTIISNTNLNTARNPIVELFYGSPSNDNTYSRFLFHFDETRLRTLYSGGVLTDLTKLTHKLKMTNTAAIDKTLINGVYGSMQRTSSFDLIIFPITDVWDEGVGHDYFVDSIFNYTSQNSISVLPSNWISPSTGNDWTNGAGVYSGTPTVIATQHFDIGNENIEIDLTEQINSIITGATNYGFGIAFPRYFETLNNNNLQYVGFFSRHTQTFFEPYLETVYANTIMDDRNRFYLDKPNKLYLYVNAGGNPINLDTLPSVTIIDDDGLEYNSYDPSEVNHVTKGVYSIDITIPTSEDYTDGATFNDIWSGLTINGVNRPAVTLDFFIKSYGYYEIGINDLLPKKVGVSISGIRSQEKIKQGDIRKVIVSARVPYTIDQTQYISDLQYRLYVLEGNNQITVTDYQAINMTYSNNYFLIDTGSLVPNVYYIDILVTSNLEVTTLSNVLSFTIIDEASIRTNF